MVSNNPGLHVEELSVGLVMIELLNTFTPEPPVPIQVPYTACDVSRFNRQEKKKKTERES